MSGLSGRVVLETSGQQARVTLLHRGKFNAMSRVMWRELRAVFETIQRCSEVRSVLICGDSGHFCAGGDISEYAGFRFEEVSLRDFHENDVWGGLQAMLDCDVPMVAQIEGNCMGAGIEIASCCDIRIAADTARFGAPIARLGFPMAPREAALVMRAAGELTAREMLLSATVLDAVEMKQRGFLNLVVPAQALAAVARERVERIGQLAPRAARLNKASLRVLVHSSSAQDATKIIANAYTFASSGEHREGISAFVEKRPPRFDCSLPERPLFDRSTLMKNQNLFAALRAAFPETLQEVAIETDNGLRYSWDDLERSTAMMANLFQSLNLPEGARIAVQVEKSVEAMVLYLATLRAGYVFLPLNTAYQSLEIEYFIGNAEPAVVVCSSRNFGWISKIAFKAGTQNVFTLDDDRSGSLLARSAHCSDQHEVASRQSGDLAAILYTSGTTGRSKGAMLTHGNLADNARVLKDYWGWKKGDVLIHALPIFHVHGLFVAIHGALLNGSKMIWLSKFDARLVVKKLPEATVFMGVPTLYVRLLAEPGLSREACSKMRLFISGSAPLLIEVFNEWKQRTGLCILERYGMSETTMLTSNPYQGDERRGGTVGFALPGVSLRVQGDDDKPVPVGEIGGIEVKGPNVFKGYWRMPEKTAEEFTADGYFKTGDVGKIDERGYVTIVGRSKDLIISGGYNVYPAEIEGYINEMPGVAESALVGVPHPDFGEVGVAIVIAKPGSTVQAEQVVLALKAKLANFKIPKQCFVLGELPRNTMGKVQKNLLREQYKTLFA
ncbi:MAG: AMP-binding protein [Polaromonas sp.]|nr:AMP-binding protein [Polaromonas sp.]